MQMSEKKSSQKLLSSPSGAKWKTIGIARRAGVSVPLFSVYSKNSLGIGDLGDLRLLADWAKACGTSIVQLLPMNEVGAGFCPYDSVSSFALEPAYLCLSELPGADKLGQEISELKKRFSLDRTKVDYRIKGEKIRILWEIFLLSTPESSAEFKAFVLENRYWINDFALFKTLKENYAGKPWYEWEEVYKLRVPAALETFRSKHQQKITFEMWVQWMLFRQFEAAKVYAASKGVLLKGDLPILVSYDSADVWSHREFFKLDFVSGAPPDLYCAKGQRWGMPTYNWEAQASDGYRYLKARLKFAENFYDIIRIDHVVGLFRIWSIAYHEPVDNQGLNGFFDPKDESQWAGQGRNILSVILNNTKMLLCAEDLGTIPLSCTQALDDLGIAGNDVQRWVKDWKVRHDFLSPKEYRFLSVAMLSTHDTTSWLGWWENEAGTVDEALFIRKCSGRLDYNYIKDKVFDSSLSRHGRLRWLKTLDSVDNLCYILGKSKEELADFIEMYLNTYQEKEKLWKLMKMRGPMQEEGDAKIIAAALKMALDSQAVFSVQLITDWLGLTNILQGDPYEYRFNTPGTVGLHNWSRVMPVLLEDLLKDKVCAEIKKMVSASNRV